MKVAVPIIEKDSQAELSHRFGRSAYFGVYDTIDTTITFLDNPFYKEYNAGHKTVKYLLENQIDFVIAEKIGPKSFQKLSSFKIQFYKRIENANLSDQIFNFIDGKLEKTPCQIQK